MEDDRDDYEKEKDFVSFALLIQASLDGLSYKFTSKNEGIPEADVILFVECWLEKVKDLFKNNIKANI